jgi:hypothetical protein
MSGIESGRNKVAVGIAKETTRGTAATATKWYPWMSLDFIPKNKKIFDNAAFNVLEENSTADIIQSWSEGKLEGRILDQSFGYLLYNIFGTHAAALHTGETVVYDHTFTESQSNIPQSLTFTTADANLDNQFPNGMVKSLEIQIAQGKYCTFTAALVASAGSSFSDTVTYTQENAFTSQYATVKLATTVAGLTGATAAVIKSLKATIDKGVEPWFGIGQNAPYDIYAQSVKISGDLTLRYLDLTYETLDFNNTTNAMLIDLKNTGVTIGTATNPELQLQFDALKFENWTPAYQLDKIVEQTVSFTGLLNFTTAEGMKAILTNTLTTY